jgi:predicted nucleotidyltransferase
MGAFAAQQAGEKALKAVILGCAGEPWGHLLTQRFRLRFSRAGATYLDRAERLAQVREAARRAARRMGTIRRIVLFGSLVHGIPTPGSDADLLIIVDSSPHDEPRDRVRDLLQALTPLPCPVDLFVLTGAEVEQSRERGGALVRTALSTGMDLL